jgi:hypothetical protein
MLKVKGNSLFDEKAALKAWLAGCWGLRVQHSQKSIQLNLGDRVQAVP